MFIRKNSIFTLIFLIACGSTNAQYDIGFTRDSIEIEKGIPGTLDFEPFFKIINEVIDDNNQPLVSVIYEYESATEVVPFQRQQFEYESGNTTSFTLENWDPVLEDWVPVKLEVSSYENDLLSTFLRKKAMGGVLVNNRRWAYTYNNNNHETEKLLQGWNPGTNSWDNLSRKTTTYNNEGKILTQLLERYIDGSWKNSRRRNWIWMPGEIQPGRTLAQQWSQADQQWVNQTRKTYSMDANGLWSGSIIEEWDPGNNVWINDLKSTTFPDFPNNTSVLLGERWDNSWIPNLRSTYNFSNQLNTARLEQWNETTMEFENSLRYLSEFNTNKIPVRKVGMQKWDSDAGSWENRDYSRRITYFWSANENTPTEEIIPSNKCAIPNPYQAGTSFSCDILPTDQQLYLEVRNLYGQVVLHKNIANKQFQIDHSLTAGLYIVKIYTPNELFHLEKIVFGQ